MKGGKCRFFFKDKKKLFEYANKQCFLQNFPLFDAFVTEKKTYISWNYYKF